MIRHNIELPGGTRSALVTFLSTQCLRSLLLGDLRRWRSPGWGANNRGFSGSLGEPVTAGKHHHLLVLNDSAFVIKNGPGVRPAFYQPSVRNMGHCLGVRRHRLHDRCKVACMIPSAFASRKSEANDDEIARGHHRHDLLVMAQHVIRILKHGGLSKKR